MLNKVMLIGRLGRDPEVRQTQSGTAVANFSLATNRVWRDRDGNKQEETEWHQIVVWGRQAEVAGQYLTKGRQVFIEGRIQTRSWDDRNTGEKKYRTEIVAENFQMLGGRDDVSDSGPSYEPDQGPSSGGFDAGAEDDDIPF